MQPVGQVTRPHELACEHEAVQLHESGQLMSPQAFVPAQLI
jgi:hypothetical protein